MPTPRVEDAAPKWILRTEGDSHSPACDQVRLWLHEFNTANNPLYMQKLQLPETAERELVVLAYLEDELVGGLMGGTRLSWLKIHMLGVHKNFRQRGIGTELVAEAERHALANGCRYAYVDTVCFQAPQFYLKAGYEEAGRIADWDSHGHTKHIFVKRLRKTNG
jgi:GNAT superfamily N-acetyltransferase